MPAHFFRLETIDFIARCDGGMGIPVTWQPPVLVQRMRHQRHGLNAGGERGRARSNAHCNFQKVPAFHDIFPLAERASDAGKSFAAVR
jgi:hypothetical protein